MSHKEVSLSHILEVLLFVIESTLQSSDHSFFLHSAKSTL